MELYAARFYTCVLDAVIEESNTIQYVLKKFLLEKLPLNGTMSAQVHMKGEGEGTPPQADIDVWRKVRFKVADTPQPSTVTADESGTRRPSKSQTIDEILEEATEEIVAVADSSLPGYQHLFLHWCVIVADAYEGAIGFFRVESPSGGFGPFTESERKLLDVLAPYMAQIYQLDVLFKLGRNGYRFFLRRTRETAEQFGLTPMEYRVLHALITGEENAAIAKALGVSLSTVKTHITHILQKTGCRNRNALLGHYFSAVSNYN